MVSRKTLFFNPLLLLFTMAVAVMAVLYSPVSADAAYYLGIARDISNGLVPYADVKNAYTPLMMYMNSWIFNLQSGFNYWLFILFQYFIIISSAAALYYACAKSFSLEKRVVFLLSLLFLAAFISADGYYIILEPYLVLFTLLAFNAVSALHAKPVSFFVAGFFLGLGFLSKQYGALAIFPFGYLLLNRVVKKEIRFNKIWLFTAGGFTAILIFISFFISKGVSPAELKTQLVGGAQDYAETGVKAGKSIFTYFLGGKVFFMLAGVLLFLYRYVKPAGKNSIALFSLIGIIVFLIPTAIKSYQHYFINTFPYLFILSGWVLKNSSENFYQSGWRFYIIPGLAFIFLTITSYRVLKYKSRKKNQEQIAATALKRFPANSSLYIVGENRFLYLVNNYSNSAAAQIGYSYSIGDSKKFIQSGCTSPFILSDKEEERNLITYLKPCDFLLLENTGR